jgi:hypothetical protein
MTTLHDSPIVCCRPGRFAESRGSGLGKKGNADVWIGHFDEHMHIDSLKPLTRTNRWESSPRWGTAPLLE